MAAKVPSAVDLTDAWRVRVTWWWIAAVPSLVALLIHRRWPWTALGLAASSGVAHLLDRDLGLLPLDASTVRIAYRLARVTPTRRCGLVAVACVQAAAYLAALAATRRMAR